MKPIIASFFSKKTTIVGIEVTIRDDGFFFDYTLFIKNKNDFSILESQENVSEDKLTEVANKNKSAIVFIKGTKIVIKELDSSVTDIDEYTKNIVPEDKRDNFHLEYKVSDSWSTLSIIKKEIYESIIAHLNKLGFYIVTTYLSPLIVSALLDEVKSIDTKLGEFHKNDDLLIWSKNNDESRYIDIQFIKNLPVKNYQIFTFAAVKYFFSNEVFKSESSSYIHYEIYHKSIKFVPLVILVFLVINTLFYYQYTNQNNEIQQSLSVNSNHLFSLDSMNKIIVDQNSIIDSLGWKNSISPTFISDRIAASKPDGIILQQLLIFPENEKETDNELIETPKLFRSDRIKIKGECKEAIIMNDWKNTLLKLPYISEVEVINYTKTVDSKAGIFIIEISLK